MTPAFSTTPTLAASTTLPATTEFVARRFNYATNAWSQFGPLPINGSQLCFGSSSSGGTTGSFLTGFGVSPDGRFVVGQGYTSTYNTAAGNAISANSFRWRAWLYDSQANGGAGQMFVLPTPNRTTSNTFYKRNGIAYDVSADGSVIVGATEHNTGSSNDDGARLCVWRWNSTTSTYDITYLTSGGGITSTASGVAMNDAGTIIAARAYDGITTFVAKWTWNGTTWDPPVSIGANLSSPASWLPGSVLSCGVNQPVPQPNLGGSLAMSEDGSVIVGSAVYSTCGSFMSGGFIWHQSTGLMQDWYDYLVDAGAPGVAPNGTYGPIGDLGDPAKGLPRIGYPIAISADGNNITCLQGGTQRIVGAVPTLVQLNPTIGGCAAPFITLNPSNSTFTRCSTLILNAGAAGSGPISYQWQKGGVNVNDGTTVDGTVISGAATQQMRITNGHPSDAGQYACVITGACGAPITTTAANVTVDPAASPLVNDTCGSALAVGEGTFNFNPCGAYIDDAIGASCASSDRDAWFSYTPTFTGEARFQTCGGSYDTVISLYSDCNGSEIACNDNWIEGPGGCTANRSRIARYPVNAGQPILVRVGTVGSIFSFTGQLQISQAPSLPANDDCVNATTIGAGVTAFDLSEATSDGFSSCQPTAGSVHDVWFRFQPECDGVYTFQTCGSTISNPLISLQNACGQADFACSDNVGSGVSGCTSNQARIQGIAVKGGSPILVRVAMSGTTVQSPATGNLTILKVGCITDLNDDGNADQADVDYLINVIAGGDNPTNINPDFNCDGNADQGDVDSLINVVAGGNCPS